MNKIGLIFDSSSGITKDEANKLGVGFIPLNITINNKEYEAGVNITREELYELMNNKETNIKTSSPTGENIKKAIDSILENHEKAIYIGISHKWSGTQNAVESVIKNFPEYKDKIIVYKSLYSSPWIGLFIKDALDIISNGKSIEEFMNLLDIASRYMIAYLSPGNIWWFYKGGRITKMQYILGTVAKVQPVLKYEDGAIDQNGAIKARGRQKAMSKMTEGIKNDLEKLKSLPKDLYKIIALKTNNDEMLSELLKTIEIELAIPREEVIIDQLSSEQIAHMGPNSFGIGIYVSLKDIVKANLN